MTKRKLIALATSAALVLSSAAAPIESNAATTLKITNVSSNKKTMYVGKKFTIKTNVSVKKLTFKSSKTTVATVSKKGVVKARKKGTCKITITAKLSSKVTKKKTIKLTVKKKTTTTATSTPKVTATVTPTATVAATTAPTTNVTTGPTAEVTTAPTVEATTAPTAEATTAPTAAPTTEATTAPTAAPTTAPTAALATEATTTPTETPVVTRTPQASATPEATTAVTAAPEITVTPVVTESPEPAAATAATTEPETTAAPAETTEPQQAAGTVFVTSIAFTDNGITLQDEAGETVEASDASNLIVDGTCVTITAPTNDLENSKNDKEIAISGTCSEGQIRVNVDKTTYPKGCVELSLTGLELSNTTTSPIYIASIGDECVISVKKGTTNVISDGTNYKNEDDDTGAIYSKDDLKIKGKGTLTVNGNCGYGIITKNDLKVYNGTINVTSVNAALKGKDSVKIGDKDDIGKEDAFANLSLTLKSTAGDGVRSNNPIDDETKAAEDSDYADGKSGTIVINGGTILVTSYADAFQSAGDLTVNGGDITMYTYEGSGYESSKQQEGSWGGFPGQNNNTTTTDTSNDVSAKGLKAGGNLTVNAGTITGDCSDDTLHCGGALTIEDGTLNLATGDDGIHSDSTLTINNGTIHITKSYEGIEGIDINVNGGNIYVVSSDDGFNASDGSGEQNPNGGGGMGGPNGSQAWQGNTNTSTSTNTCNLTINDGYVYVSAEGDGLDSNGNLYIKGGTTIVVGPSAGGNGSFDHGDGNYVFEMTGGIAIAVGSSGMPEYPSNTTNYLTRSLSTTGSENTVAIVDSNNNVLSILKFSKSAQLLTYFNANTTASDCKVYLNPTYDGTFDDNGYAAGGTITGGTELTESASNTGTFPGQNQGGDFGGRR